MPEIEIGLLSLPISGYALPMRNLVVSVCGGAAYASVRVSKDIAAEKKTLSSSWRYSKV